MQRITIGVFVSLASAVFFGYATMAAGISATLAGRVVPPPYAQHAPKERVEYIFESNGQGAHPLGPLAADGKGNYYTATSDGGVTCGLFVCGTIVKLTPMGNHFVAQVLYSFQNIGDGYSANPGLIVDSAGAIVGTSACCESGEVGAGVLFKLAPTKNRYTFTTLFAFSGSGPYPNGGLIGDKTGSYFGTAYQGGSSPAHGAAFELTPSGGGFTETTIYSFQGGNDGSNPAAGLTFGAAGRFYGTTSFGGGNSCNQGAGCGTVFELIPSGSSYKERVLYSFQGGHDGDQPVASLVERRGTLYGTTEFGGDAASCAPGCGTVFALQHSGTRDVETVIYNFPKSGAYPAAPVVVDKAESLFGSTTQGGTGNNGTVFKLTPSQTGYVESDLHVMQGPPNDGELPNAVTFASSQSTALVGTTTFGGNGPASQCGNLLGCGVVYMLRGDGP